MSIGHDLRHIFSKSSLPSKISKNPSKSKLRCLTLNHHACNILVDALTRDAHFAIMSSDNDLFIVAHELWTRTKSKYFKSKSIASSPSSVCGTNHLTREEKERWRPNEESTSPKGMFSHVVLHASANHDDRENETEEEEEEEIRKFYTLLNKQDKAILMKLLRRNDEQGETLLKLEKVLIETKDSLEKMEKEHDEQVSSHVYLVQRYESVLIEQVNNENTLSSIAQAKIESCLRVKVSL
jgi:hypothetical protein